MRQWRTLVSRSVLGSLRCATNFAPARQEHIPTKDRYPPRGYDPNNRFRRLAVLIDGSKIHADTFVKTIEPGISKVGIPLLVRVFDYQDHLSPDWYQLVAGPGDLPQVQKDLSLTRPLSSPGVEWFRVEKFIPIRMQMAADAAHIHELRFSNKIEGVVYVCCELERPAFEKYFERLKGTGFNQYSFDELGLGQSMLEDGRSSDGS